MKIKAPGIAFFLAALIVVAAITTAGAHPGAGIVVDRRGRVYFVDTGGGVWGISEFRSANFSEADERCGNNWDFRRESLQQLGLR